MCMLCKTVTVRDRVGGCVCRLCERKREKNRVGVCRLCEE